MEDIGVNIVVWQNVVTALAVILMAAWALLVAYSRHHLGAVLVSICCNFSCYQDPFDFAVPQKILHIRSSLEATKEVFITLQISAVIVSRGIPYRVATS